MLSVIWNSRKSASEWTKLLQVHMWQVLIQILEKAKKCKFDGFFRKKGKGQAWKKPKTNQQGKNDVSVLKPKKKLNMTKLKCHNFKNKGHFARDCPEPKKTQEPLTI
uniref:Uncharacterized protein LOC104238627 n=1 Tax=Nicotiana sylvestris TaxID=4096 RepID=A0A1U7XWN3_NICSY|nr:PREDICTED: uncharacterized protein LOC104238627 [Nicotiana sylvestris]